MWKTPNIRAALALALALALSASAALAVGPKSVPCGKDCVLGNVSVVNAAGIPDATLRPLVAKLQFSGAALAGASDATVRQLAAQMRSIPTGQCLTLQVTADPRLSSADAQRQVIGRAQSLSRSLLRAGAPQGSFDVEPAAGAK